MIRYSDDSIKQKLIEAFAFCCKNKIEIDNFYDLENEEDYTGEDVLIDYETKLFLGLPYCDDYEELTVGEFVKTVQEVKKAEMVDNLIYFSPNRVLIRVASLNSSRIIALEDADFNIFTTEIDIGKQIIHFNIVNGLTNFAILTTVLDDYDKHTPPLLYDDMFVEIYSQDEIPREIIDELLQAYIFELSSTLEVEIFTSPRSLYYDFYGSEEIDEQNKLPKLRPLKLGNGVSHLLSIYNQTTSTNIPEILILYYTKVLEYVSTTVVKREMIEAIFKKLHSPKVLTPDANFILELEKAFEEQNNYKKDKEAIRLTIETCCDASEFIGNAPKYLVKLNRLGLESSKEEKKQALNELATAISDTRNMIAHAKTNYKQKGMECPCDEYLEFVKCLKIASNQVIRWFIRQSTESRVV